MASFGFAETSLLVNTSGIRAAAQRIKDTLGACGFRTDRDVRGYQQKRCFCAAKTRRQQMYREVHLLTRYLHRLFQKADGVVCFSTAMDGGGSM